MKEELKKWDHNTSSKKEDLINRLVAAIGSNVPVTASVVARHKSMNGLDVTSKWVLFMLEDLSVEPSIEPPTEGDAPTKQKYGFNNTFARVEFSGKFDKMNYIRNPFTDM